MTFMSEYKDIHNIANRIKNTQDNIEKACNLAGRDSVQVQLMAVSKTKPKEAVVAAYEAGQRIFGENYAQELADKSAQLAHLSDIEWHYIGPIQSNKTKLITQSCDWIDSLDRLKIAKRINQHAIELNKTINLLIQVNISDSDTKSGLKLADVSEFAKELALLERVTLRGLMAIPDKNDDENKLKQEFKQMHTCYLQLQQQYKEVDTLSLGMSQDMVQAIECGSTMVRIGTDIFGARS